MLQGYLAVKILRKYEVSRVQSLVGSVFFVIAPTVLEKMFRHTALGGQWIILLTIYIFACHRDDYEKVLKSSAMWFAVGLLVSGIHLYFLPMVVYSYVDTLCVVLLRIRRLKYHILFRESHS